VSSPLVEIVAKFGHLTISRLPSVLAGSPFAIMVNGVRPIAIARLWSRCAPGPPRCVLPQDMAEAMAPCVVAWRSQVRLLLPPSSGVDPACATVFTVE
jgi:hypothetical protein